MRRDCLQSWQLWQFWQSSGLVVAGSSGRLKVDAHFGLGPRTMFQFFQTWGFHVPGKAEHAEHADAVPVDIEFIPGKSVTRRLWVRVVVVMPAFAEREHGDPEAVARGVRGEEAALAPHV